MSYEMINSRSNKNAACNCRPSPTDSDPVNDLWQKWIAEHPLSTRKEQVFALELLRWVECQSKGGR